MTTDRPQLIPERPRSFSTDICYISSGPLIAPMNLSLEESKYRQDECPTKPQRRNSNGEADGDEPSEADSITYDDNNSDHSKIVSDITHPTLFDSMDEDVSVSFNSSINSVESQWQHGTIESSLRIETSEPQLEGLDERDTFDLQARKRSSSLSLVDTAIFDSETKDMPPQLAVRYHPSTDCWAKEVQPIEDRFGGTAPDDREEPIMFPSLKRSYSQQTSKPTTSGLQKLAEAFTAGCAIGTNTYRLKKYPRTFVGSQAIDYMLSANFASTREDAVFLGQQFCKELNLFHHVCWDHTFKDGQFFYRFNDECSKDVRCATPLSRGDLVTMSKLFAEEMPVSTHKSRRFKTYRNTFLGADAVNHMLQSKLASNRLAAVFLGQRMMEELEIFQPVAHNSRFKDSCNLYQFVTDTECEDTSFDEKSCSMSFLMERAGGRLNQSLPMSPLPPTTDAERWGKPSSRSAGKRKNQRVAFGMVESRCFERRLECNPATTSGPSLGLGWRFYDDSPIPLDEKPTASESQRGRLSSQDRTMILKEWGYNKADIYRAARRNQTIRRKRKESLNKNTTNSSLVEVA